MIERLTVGKDGAVEVHLTGISLQATKAFTHGTLGFDLQARTVTFGKLAPVALPAELQPSAGAAVHLRLLGPDGELRKQTRSGTWTAVGKQPHLLRIGGHAQTARKFPAEEGWSNRTYKYRAYFSHPGAETDGELPEWLRGSIARQRAYWNRLAWLCRDARRKCSTESPEQVAEFVGQVIVPAIDAFNEAIGPDRRRAKERLKHPQKLKDRPGIDGLWAFAGLLRAWEGKGHPVPEGLMDRVLAFAKQFQPDYAPLNEFMRDLSQIAAAEAERLELKWFEVRPELSSFKATLDRRRTVQASWSDGWPMLRFAQLGKDLDWGLHYYLRKAGVGTELLETGKGVPGLSLGAPLSHAETGHPHLCGAAAKRALREARISIPGEGKDRWIFRFAVLEHRPLPAHAHVKEWKLVFKGGELWLCLVVEMQQPLPEPSAQAAGLDIGWRRTAEGIRFGTLYEPLAGTVRLLEMDFGRSPRDPADRVPFRIDLGPSRWQKRNQKRLFPEPVAEGESAAARPHDGAEVPGLLETGIQLQTRRDYEKDTVKILLRRYLGERTPPWLDRAGLSGLRRLREELKDDAGAWAILEAWRLKDDEIGALTAFYFARSTRRIEYGHLQVAHDVCRHLRDQGVSRLAVETSFLAKLAQNQSSEVPVALKRSQKYRQVAALGKFVAVLRNTAIKYGVAVDEHDAANTTRICRYCNHLNEATEREKYNCAACGRELKQDENAAVNLSRFAADPELAEMALQAGRK
jgi:hypothetical protein